MKKNLICLFVFLTFPLVAMEFPLCPIKKIPLKPDYIALHHPVSTSSAAAQLYFDQGLTMMYAFNHDAAFCSFQQASEHDPDLAMAYWGMAIALGQNINTDITFEREKAAFNLVKKARELASKASPVEQDYITALSARYSDAAKPDLKQLAINYHQAMKQLAQKYSDDPDAVVLYAESGLDLNPWNQWTTDGKPLEGTWALVNALEDVLKRNPMHLGANHFYVHAMEASEYPERALISADRLRKLLPSSGHILHMPSHIYILVGDYRQAAEANEEAIAADREYIREYGMEGFYPVHYLSHNLYFLSRAYSMEGRFQRALQAAKELESFYTPYFKMMPDLEYYAPTSMFVMLRFSQWNEILELPEPPANMAITRALWHFARGMAYAANGDVAKAEQEKRAFLEGKDKLKPDAIYGYNKAAPIFQIAEHLLNGKIADQQNNLPLAIENYNKAVAVQDTLHYNEPPDWFFPVRETLGGALLRNKQYKEAEKVFRDDLSRHPRNGRSLYGLRESLSKQERDSDAYWVNQEYEEAWKYSDTPLSLTNL